MVQMITSETALITGASSGIGAVYADRLAKRGHGLVLVARDTTRLEALATQLRRRYGVEVAVLPADLTSETGLSAVEHRLETDAAITMLVNNAGIAALSSLADMRPEDIGRMVQLNVTAAARVAAVAARAFSLRGKGTIINIASVLALVSERFNPIYNATKAFVLSLTQSMQRELGPLGIYVQAVLPGATRTEIWSRAGGDISALPPDAVMDVDEMVDAALVGLDQREAVTIPSLPDAAEFEAFTNARLALAPNLSRNHAAARYRVAVTL